MSSKQRRKQKRQAKRLMAAICTGFERVIREHDGEDVPVSDLKKVVDELRLNIRIL